MKTIYLSLLTCASLLVSLSALANDPCIVLDLDSTFVERIPRLSSENAKATLQRLKEQGQVFDAIGEYNSRDDYFLAAGAEKFIKNILSLNKFKIKFFSSGVKIRNDELVGNILKSMFTPDELENLQRQGQFKVFSKGDLFNLEFLGHKHMNYQPSEKVGENLSFLGGRKKHLASIGCSQENSVLIDDDYTYVIKGEEKNYVYVQWRFSIERLMEYNFNFKDKDDSWHAVNHFYYAAGLIWSALDLSEQEQISLPEALHRLQYNAVKGWYDYHSVSKDKRYYERGFELLGQSQFQ